MIKPPELSFPFQIKISNGISVSTGTVWEILMASRDGDLEKVKKMATDVPELLYAQYNYTPPIHFAVREGHLHLVEYLLKNGALDPTYITYPFKDTLVVTAEDRGYSEIAGLIRDYLNDPGGWKYKGDNGEIDYNKTPEFQEFENTVDKNEILKVEELLKQHPEFAHEQTAFWGEGILMMPAKDNDNKMVELLIRYGATVPSISKWGRFYYFKHFEMAEFLVKNGMDPNHMTWHYVTLLHDMAQEGDTAKASLLIDHGAGINTLEEEYQSTPLGLASRWGHTEMVSLLLSHGADINKAGAPWATPLEWARKKGHPGIELILVKAGAHSSY